jgi:protein MpaA
VRVADGPGVRAFCFVAVLALAGCASRPLATPEPIPPIVAERVAGLSVEDRPIDYTVIGRGQTTVLILATIHGNEAAGTPLVERLQSELAAQPELVADRTIVLVPVVNPDGLAADTRRNATGVDLNRNYPADNWSNRGPNGSMPSSEPETRAVLELLDRYAPDRVVSIHQPLRCIDYDGPARALAEAMAAACDLPVRRLGTRPGSLGAYVGEDLGVPIITVELPGRAERAGADALWERYGAMLVESITFME